MSKKNKELESDEITIDLVQLAKALWKKVWAIILVAVITGGMGLSYALFFVKPQYSSEIMLYVNNSSFAVGDTEVKISSGDLTAAQSLVKTYIVLLKNRTTLERVIEKSGVNYDYKQLIKMVDASPVDDTEVFAVKVTCNDPYEASKIVNTIAEVLPERVKEIVDGASMEVVDSGIVNHQKVSPSLSKYTFMGGIIGAMLVVAIITISVILDNRIHNEEYVIQTFDYPLLAKIPDLVEDDKNSSKYYYRR